MQALVNPAHRPGLAPWLDVRAEKRQYYAYRSYAPPELVVQLDKPVANPAFRTLLAGRAAAFRSGSRNMRLGIDPDAIVDIGAERPQDANTVALVDLAKSAELQAALRRELRVDAEKNYVIVTMASTFAREPGAVATYTSRDALTVTVAAKDHSRATLWELRDGQWHRASGTTEAVAQIRDPRLVQRKRQPRSVREYRNAVNLTNQDAQAPVIRDGTLEYLLGLQSNYQIQKGLADLQNAEAVRSQAEKKNEEKKNARTQSIGDAAAQPPRYTSCGLKPPCRQFCSSSSCRSCCTTALIAEQTTAGSASFACHAASDLCPWCHLGCAMMTAALAATSATHFGVCTSGCGSGIEVPASHGNPKHCPVK